MIILSRSPLWPEWSLLCSLGTKNACVSQYLCESAQLLAEGDMGSRGAALRREILCMTHQTGQSWPCRKLLAKIALLLLIGANALPTEATLAHNGLNPLPLDLAHFRPRCRCLTVSSTPTTLDTESNA